MGMNHQEESHESRSSNMSLALRWKRENLRWILISAAAALAVTIMVLVSLQVMAADKKKLTIVVDGKEKAVHTSLDKVQQLLDEESIKISDYDQISVPVNSAIKDGSTVIIKHAQPVLLTIGGKTSTVYTTENSVKAVLQQQNIALGTYDKVKPDLQGDWQGTGRIQIIRVQKKSSVTKHVLPFQTVKTANAKLYKGKQLTVQQGKKGLLVKTFELVYEDGKLVSNRLVGKTVQIASVNKVIAVGTKKRVAVLSASEKSRQISVKGVKINAKRVLTNVSLTAYSAGVESTGKSSKHPQYGLTYSGTRVTEGRTIAVDPKVIPIGWWVYIEGIGLRRAEDTGSAVKGKKIDVYFDSESYAEDFGIKHGYKVYVIGPKKPSTD